MEEFTAADGTIRKAYYGAGRQPFDDIVSAGWGPAFAAGNVLKYLRRDKDQEHSLRSARWYWREIVNRCDNRSNGLKNTWWVVGEQLRLMLITEEIERLSSDTHENAETSSPA